jgi:hypothetical protein
MTFDRLSWKNLETRSPNDVIKEQVLNKLIERVNLCENINAYVNKFVAHSATPESRELVDYITIDELWKAQRIVFEVADFLSQVIFSTSRMPLPIENHSFYDHWNAPIFAEQDFSRFNEALKKYRDETIAWISTINTPPRPVIRVVQAYLVWSPARLRGSAGACANPAPGARL